MNELALFAGAGGGILVGILCGWRTVCAVEIEEYPRRVLMQRQDDGILPPFPIWDDIRTFDGRPWRGVVDIVTGGFPCQDISCAGKGAGLDGARSGLWREMARVVREVGPRFVLVENSPMLTSRGLGHVLRDLAKMGYDARWGVFSACSVGAPHVRERVFVLANTYTERRENSCWWTGQEKTPKKRPFTPTRCWRAFRFSKSDLFTSVASGIDNGLARELVQRNRSIGNGQVPAVVRLAWETLKP